MRKLFTLLVITILVASCTKEEVLVEPEEEKVDTIPPVVVEGWENDTTTTSVNWGDF